MILLIDNYDSFSYNLYQMIGELVCGADDGGQNGRDPAIRVIRNDEMTVDQIRSLRPDRVILSPGPGRPEQAGVTMAVAKKLGREVPLLGVCLGHQAICAAFGADITYAGKLMHGKQSEIRLAADCPIFAGCPEQMPVARYHSLAAKADTIPETLRVTAYTGDGEVMAVQHREYPIFGLQFHPESILTPMGKTILKNFICL
jgi:anthranilate synthase component 2